MPPDTRRLKAEIVHCLFLDIVGYSRASIQQQRRMARQLQDAVRAAPEFQRAQADGELILRDMGDGMALIFQNDPVAPVQCAVEIARAVQNSASALPIRMGIHTGPVTHDTDITDAASGTRLTIDDFTQEQVSELNLRYGGPLHGPGELSRFYALVSGHPYLVRRGLDEMVTKSLSIADLESQADRDEGLYGDHLRRFLVSLTKDEHLTDVIRGLLRGDACPTQESFYRLRSAGLLVGDSVREARVRYPFYASYLARHLG